MHVPIFTIIKINCNHVQNGEFSFITIFAKPYSIHSLLFLECHDCYIEFSGDNLENPVDEFEGGPKACQALCAATPGCKFFTWRNAGTCLLKTKIGNKNPNLNAISGGSIDHCAAGMTKD